MGEGQRIESLQALRFIAAAMVVVYHLGYLGAAVFGRNPAIWWINGASLGASGVDIFFVVSGLIISRTGPLASNPPGGVSFAWRRWRRVAPVYFIVSIPQIAFAGLHQRLNAGQLAETFLFWPSSTIRPYLDQGWTLCFEMVFYLALSMTLVVGRPRRNLVILLAGAGVMVAVGWLNPLYLEFGAGVGIAWLAERGRFLTRPIGTALIVLGIVVLVASATDGASVVYANSARTMAATNGGRILFFGIPAAMIVAGALALEPSRPGAVLALLSKGGDASYSIYLCHVYAISTVRAIWAGLRLFPAGLEVVGFLAAIGLGLVVYAVIERPILRDLKRLRLPPPRAATRAA